MMSRFSRLVSYLALAAVVTGCSEATIPPTHEYFLVVTDAMTKEERQAAGMAMQQLVGTTAPPGTPVTLLHMPSQQVLAMIEVPDRPTANARFRDQSVAAEFAKLAPFFTGEDAGGSDQLDMPSLPGTINGLRQSSLPIRMILFGSPIYHDEQQPGWSFKDGWYPSDTALVEKGVPLHTQPFTCEVEINICARQSWGLNARHRDAVTRVWSLWATAHNATLCRITSDARAAMDFERRTLPTYKPQEMPVGMLHVGGMSTREASPLPAGNAVPVVPTSHTEEPMESAPGQLPMSKLRGRLRHVVFLVDTSGSMVTNAEDQDLSYRFAAVLNDLRQQLRDLPMEKLSLCAFGGDDEGEPRLAFFPAGTSAAWVSPTRTMREVAIRATATWQAAGCTPLLAALQSIEHLEEIDTVIIYSDGCASDAPEASVIALVRKMAQRGIVTNTIGVGPMAQSELRVSEQEELVFMQRLALAGGGAYLRL